MSEQIQSQWTSRGFNDRFEQIVSSNKENPDFRYVHAYLQAEEEHIKAFGSTRFSSYDSFRKVRQKFIFGT